MMSTNDLIELLVADARPVRRLWPPAVRALCWLLFAVLVLALVGIANGTRPDLMLHLRQPVFAISLAGMLLTAILAAVASFVASVPGRSPRWLLLPVPPLVVWVSTIGYGCLTNWVSVGPGGVALGETARCFATLVLVGGPLSFAMLVMLRHTTRLRPASVTLVATLAVAGMTSAGLALFHPLDATVMILIWNVGIAGLLVAFGGLYGRRALAWVEPN